MGTSAGVRRCGPGSPGSGEGGEDALVVGGRVRGERRRDGKRHEGDRACKVTPEHTTSTHHSSAYPACATSTGRDAGCRMWDPGCGIRDPAVLFLAHEITDHGGRDDAGDERGDEAAHRL